MIQDSRSSKSRSRPRAVAEKYCKECRRNRPIAMFGHGGRNSNCDNCRIQKTERVRRFRERNPTRHLKTLFGGDFDYDRTLAAQGGGCGICGKAREDNGQRLAVDHAHPSRSASGGKRNRKGQARGILCRNCNQGLGRFRDDPDLLRRAIAYLS